MKDVCSAVLAVLALLAMVACGGGSNSTTPVVVIPVDPPHFSSVPVTAASEGVTYTYKLAAIDSRGMSIRYALTTAPVGATLSGDTITWTPTAEQSRVKNDFAVRATASPSEAYADQSWSVTPNGTIHLRSDYTLWSADGATTKHVDYTAQDPMGNPIVGPYALAPQADGSYKKLTGTGTADGQFSIPNVPAGYFWLIVQSAGFWTSSSLVDLGGDTIGATSATVQPAQTNFDLSFDGLDPIQAGGELVVASDYSMRSFDTVLDTSFASGLGGLPITPTSGAYEIGGTRYKGRVTKTTSKDFSKVRSAFVGQYNPISLGDTTALVLGPSLLIGEPSWTNGGNNTVSGTLTKGAQSSFDLNVKGSEWQALLNGVTPTQISFDGSKVGFAVQPWVRPNSLPAYAWFTIPMLAAQRPLGLSQASDCSLTSGYSVTSSGWKSVFYWQPAITTDRALGTISYSDPFPADWSRVFSFCQGAQVSVPIAGADASANLNLGYGLETASPTNPVTPLVGPVQNPTMAANSVMAPFTVNSSTPVLSWTAPSVGKPSAYRVIAVDVTGSTGTSSTAATDTSFQPPMEYNTTKTSVSLLLIPGHTYVFEIVAIIDPGSKIETSPLRSALPRGYATTISASITVGPSPAPVVTQ